MLVNQDSHARTQRDLSVVHQVKIPSLKMNDYLHVYI